MNWYDFVNQLDIVDELVKVKANGHNVYISNYSTCNLIKDTEFQHIDLNPSTLMKLEVMFLAQHKQTLKKLNDYFKTDLEIRVGLVSYCR